MANESGVLSIDLSSSESVRLVSGYAGMGDLGVLRLRLGLKLGKKELDE